MGPTLTYQGSGTQQAPGGHRKISAALATFAAGDTLGKDTLLWLWALADGGLGGALGAMPESVALELIMLASLAAFYWTNEETVRLPQPPAQAEAAAEAAA
jgi:hypothetical protein